MLIFKMWTKPVTNPPHTFNIFRMCRIILQLFPEVEDEIIDSTCGWHGFESPHFVEQIVPVHCFSFMNDKIF